MSTKPDDSAAVQVGWRKHAFDLAMAGSAARYVPRLPKAMLDDLFPGVGDLTISIQHDMKARALAYGEAYVLSLITAYVRPRRIFEIGTASGQGTLLMARQAPGARIDTVDLGNSTPSLGKQLDEPPWIDLETIGSAWRETEHASHITQHFADSARFDYTSLRHAIDLVFVDGAHTYDYVRADSEAALMIAAPGAAIVWDDCNYVCPGVSKALLELRGRGLPVYRIYGTRFGVLRLPAERSDGVQPVAATA